MWHAWFEIDMSPRIGLGDDHTAMGMTRRGIMRSVGGAAGSTLLVGAVHGRSTGQVTEFEGVSYDPLTHEFQRVARAEIETHADGITGRLEVGGFNIPITGPGSQYTLKPTEGDAQTLHYAIINDPEANRKDSAPLQVQFQDYGHGLAGTITRPGQISGELAFTLGNVETGPSWETIRDGLTGGGDGKPDVSNKDIPERGIPDPRPPSEVSNDG